MLRQNMHKVLLVFLSCFIILVFAVPAAHAAENETVYPGGMLTAPPPAKDFIPRYESVTSPLGTGTVPMGSINPGDVYLDSGIVNIAKNPNGTIALSGSTSAYVKVQEIGLRLTLQRWTGTYWTSVYTSSDFTAANAASVNGSANASASAGYYYRVMGTHWINHLGVNEQGITYGEPWSYE